MKNIYFLFFILLIAAFLRFYQLGNIAPSLTWDEVAWGYNAYSLGIDGRDEFGRFLPYNYLESFGDFKPPVYAYLDILPVKLFGLNEFTVRFPSALFGTLTILVTYFLVKAIFIKRETAQNLALITSFLLAISPWHIMLSRAAFEANIASFLIITGVWLFLEAIQKKPWLLTLSATAFVLSIYTFNTARIVSPILVIILTLVFWKKLWSIRKATIMAVIIGIILVLPTLSFLFSPQARLRFQEVNIFSDINVIQQANQEIANDNNAWWSRILHNRRFAYARSYASHYLENFSPLFLFIKGDGNPKFSTQTVGQMYLFELPFFIAGILFLFRKREKNWWIIPVWLLVAIIPAATARETPHALRIETALPTFQILTAYGAIHLLRLISNIKYQIAKIHIKYLIFTLYFLFFISNFLYFLEDYFAHYSKKFSQEWQYGYKDAINYIDEVKDDYDVVHLTRELGRPYIYFVFYEQYDPKLFRQQAVIKRNSFGFVTVESLDKYYFDLDLAKSKNKHTLYIITPPDLPKNANIKKTFYLPDGTIALIAYAEN